MYCKKCGKEITEDTYYCPYCGEKTDIHNTVQSQKDDIYMIGPNDRKMHLGTMLGSSFGLALTITFFLDWTILAGIVLFAAIFLVEIFIAFCQGRRF